MQALRRGGAEYRNVDRDSFERVWRTLTADHHPTEVEHLVDCRYALAWPLPGGAPRIRSPSDARAAACADRAAGRAASGNACSTSLAVPRRMGAREEHLCLRASTSIAVGSLAPWG